MNLQKDLLSDAKKKIKNVKWKQFVHEKKGCIMELKGGDKVTTNITSLEPHWLTENEAQTLGKSQSTKRHNGDPTIKLSGRWYFFDETWGALFGPFLTRDDCDMAANQYQKTV